MSAYPRLRPLEPDALKTSADLPEADLMQAGEPATWEPLIQALSAPERGPLLLRSLAWGLPTTELLWWACLSARLEEIVSGQASRSQALVLAERWLREKDDSVRYEAYQRSRAEKARGAAPLVAMAAFASGPSLAPAGSPPEPPPPELGRDTATSALLVAAAAPHMGETGFSRVNAIGLEIAAGGDGREAARRGLAPVAEAAEAG